MRQQSRPDAADESLAAAARSIDPAVLGTRIRNLRLAAGLTQGELGGSDASIAYISRIEAGKRRPDLALLSAIAARVGATADELLHGVSRDRRAEWRLALDYAELSLRSGNAAAALDKSTEVLDGAVQASVAELVSESTLIKALALEALGHLDDAVIELEHLVEGDDTSAQWIRAAIALTRCYRESGDLVRATEAGERALRRLQPAGLDASTEGVQLVVTLASVYHERGDSRHAIRLCRSAATKAEELDSPEAKAAAYWNASIFESDQGRVDAAIPLAKHALSLLETGSDNRHLAQLHSQLGMFLLAGDVPDPAAARVELERAATELEWSAATTVERGYNTVALAQSVLMLGDTDGAERLLDGVADPAATAPLLAAECALMRGQIAAARGDVTAARTAYLEAVRLLTAAGADRSAAQMWVDLAAVLDELGESEAAKVAYRSAVASTGLVTARHLVGLQTR
jgi:tetratricopeptide (TPR) repeat protein